VYSFDEVRRNSTLIYQDPQGFSVRTVVGATMFITPQTEAHELRALRLDAGPATPSTILASTSHVIGQIGISDTHVYWSWDAQETSGIATHGLSRASLTGGPEEIISSLPFRPDFGLVVIDPDVYALSYPSLDNGGHDIVISHISTTSHSQEMIFSEPQGFGLAPWFGRYRDHVLWSDTSAVPPKIYAIRGAALQRDSSISCAPAENSVLVGDTMVSGNIGDCATQDIAVTATDLSTGKIEYYSRPPDDRRRYSPVGGRNGWIYLMADEKELFRVLP
jgi:hypothetical protein